MRRSINKIFRHLNNAYDNAILLVCIVCMFVGGQNNSFKKVIKGCVFA